MRDFRRRMRPALGTYVEIGVPAGDSADVMVEHAFAAIAEIDRLLNRHEPASEVSCLNDANGAWVEMSPLSRVMLRLARRMMRASAGKFDSTLGSGRASDIVFQRHMVRLTPGVRLSLDGIAKGFAVDLAVRRMKKAGCPRGWVNAGGDLRAFGDVELPVWRRESSGEYRLCGRVRDAALASSQVSTDATNESFTGRIVGGEIGVWSVLASSAWLADALTKVASRTSDGDRSRMISHLGGFLLPQGAA